MSETAEFEGAATTPAPHLSMALGEPTEQALAVRALAKTYDQTEVVHSVDLDIPKGSFYGIVGPNGAGKTTTLSMATGLLRPTSGAAWVLGIEVWRDPPAAKAKMGILADGMGTFDRLSGRELIQYVGLLRGLSAGDLTARVDELLDAMDLSDSAGKLVVDYSAGMKKKVGLACALIHAPRLLVLDEPFEAVDPVSGERIRQILRGYVANGGTVVLSSHVMELVEGICDRVAVIAEGAVLSAGTLAEVRGESSLSDRFIELVGGSGLAEGSLSWLQS